MDREEEIEHLRKRSHELRRIYCDLDDMRHWFRKNNLELSYVIDYERLSDALSVMDEVADEIESAHDKLKNEEEA
jgi:hypothetical protein